jgi:hypothetical protein
MAGTLAEALVILDSAASADALAELRHVAHVTQLLPPRIALISMSAEGTEVVRRIRGVEGVYVDDVPVETRGRLEPNERMFVDAWAARRRPKVRVGDKLDWDARGLLPPDLPSGRR